MRIFCLFLRENRLKISPQFIHENEKFFPQSNGEQCRLSWNFFELILQVPNRFVDIEVVSRGDA